MATIRLPEKDVATLLDVAGRCRDAQRCERQDVEEVLDALTSLVPCDVAFWNWYHLGAGVEEHALLAAPGGRRPQRAALGPWLEHLPEHPIMSGKHGPVAMISDVLRGRALEASWLHQEALAPAGLCSEIGVELSHGRAEMNIIVMSRGPGRPFDERDRLVLRLARPYVDAAIRQIRRPHPVLTAREREVLLLVREGLTNAQVARRLGIASATVAKHLEHVYARTGAAGRLQAVTLCGDALADEAAGETLG